MPQDGFLNFRNLTTFMDPKLFWYLQLEIAVAEQMHKTHNWHHYVDNKAASVDKRFNDQKGLLQNV